MKFSKLLLTDLVVCLLVVSLEFFRRTEAAILIPSENLDLTCSGRYFCGSGGECNYRNTHTAAYVKSGKDTFSSGLQDVVSCGDQVAWVKCPALPGRPEICSLEKRCYIYDSVDSDGKNGTVEGRFKALEIIVKKQFGAIECRLPSGASCLKFRDTQTDVGFTMGLSSCAPRSVSDSGLLLPSATSWLLCPPSSSLRYDRRPVETIHDTYNSKTKVRFQCHGVTVQVSCPDFTNESTTCHNVRQCYTYGLETKDSFGVLEMRVKKFHDSKTGSYKVPSCIFEEKPCPIFYDTPLETKYVLSNRDICIRNATTI